MPKRAHAGLDLRLSPASRSGGGKRDRPASQPPRAGGPALDRRGQVRLADRPHPRHLGEDGELPHRKREAKIRRRHADASRGECHSARRADPVTPVEWKGGSAILPERQLSILPEGQLMKGWVRLITSLAR